jgi:hypothetical protein
LIVHDVPHTATVAGASDRRMCLGLCPIRGLCRILKTTCVATPELISLYTGEKPSMNLSNREATKYNEKLRDQINISDLR